MFLHWLCYDYWRQRSSQKNYAVRQHLSVPVALHSTQSAMGLLHTILLADVITKQDRPGMWTYCLSIRSVSTCAVFNVIGYNSVVISFTVPAPGGWTTAVWAHNRKSGFEDVQLPVPRTVFTYLGGRFRWSGRSNRLRGAGPLHSGCCEAEQE